ncbi:MAG: FtsQ-type POTRA domain-containing protein [Coriobacteriia bacterium]|nr:FtsQ-type POTRA domain-containing protein [Coriobacteriia bacterium]MBS5477341.1 FtsQ-type POTRA domain-containing protein [Coriobacteriia bacterium]
MASNSGRRSSSSASRPREASAHTDALRSGAGDAGARPRSSSGRPSSSRRRSQAGSSAWSGVTTVRPEAFESSPYDARPSARGGRAGRGRREVNPRTAVYNRTVRGLVLSVVLIATVLVLYLVVMYSPLFMIRTIEATPTEHVTSQAISELAAVPEGSTLFNVSEHDIIERIEKNPWVASVSVTRQFPSQLTITVTERTRAALVMMSSGLEAWWISSDGHWLEPYAMQEATADNGVASPSDQARQAASAAGLVFVGDVAATVVPQAGTVCADAAVQGVLSYCTTFSDDMRSRIASATAASTQSISFVLTDGVEVSVGAPVDIESKERVILQLLSEHAGQVTYINVRTPATPSWRGLDG